MPQQFSPTLLTSTSFVFLQQSEILYWENNLDKEFWELKQQNQNRYSGWTVGQRKRYRNFADYLTGRPSVI